MKKQILIIFVMIIFICAVFSGCNENEPSNPEVKTVPKQERWGIYELNLDNEQASLIYSSEDEIEGIKINSNNIFP